MIRQLVQFSHRQHGLYRVRQCSDWTVREQSRCQMADPFIHEDFGGHVRLPAGRGGDTQWGNEYSGRRNHMSRSVSSSDFGLITLSVLFLKWRP